jgi:hypothetical protein
LIDVNKIKRLRRELRNMGWKAGGAISSKAK